MPISDIHNELRIDRIVPGTTHPYLGAIPTVGCIPLPINLVTTFSTDGANVIRLVGTGFLDLRLNPGDHIYNAGKLRRIADVRSNDLMTLEYAFPIDLTDQILNVPPRNKYSNIITKNVGAGTAILQEANFATLGVILTEGSPLSYDATASGLEFTCQL
jgi:hypothetical protein